MADKVQSKSDQIRALREARASRNTPEASGTTRKVPSGKAVSAPAPMTKPSRSKAHASPIRARRQVAKAPAFDAGIAGSSPAAPAKRRPGRPKIVDKRPWELEGVSRRTWYRQQERSK